MCHHDHHEHGDRGRMLGPPCGHGRAFTRRTMLGAAGAGLAAALAGCGGGPGGQVPEPVALSGGKQCDVCGMIIGKHPGPNGQVFYRDNSPEGHDNPAWFDSLKQCLFPYKLRREQRGWTAAAVYVTDYSAVEYDLNAEGGTTYISSHVAPESFARAEDLQYVVGSDVEGAMGPDFVPFSKEADARAFADEHGGDVIGYDGIDEGVIGR